MDDYTNTMLHELRKIRMLRQQKREEDDELAKREDEIVTKMFLHYEEKNERK